MAVSAKGWISMAGILISSGSMELSHAMLYLKASLNRKASSSTYNPSVTSSSFNVMVSLSLWTKTSRSNRENFDRYLVAAVSSPARIICCIEFSDLKRKCGDRKSVVWGKRWSVREDLGGRRIIKKK